MRCFIVFSYRFSCLKQKCKIIVWNRLVTSYLDSWQGTWVIFPAREENSPKPNVMNPNNKFIVLQSLVFTESFVKLSITKLQIAD